MIMSFKSKVNSQSLDLFIQGTLLKYVLLAFVFWKTVIRDSKPQHASPFKTSTPETRSSEPVTFDPERISAWLGQTHQLCSKAVQTDHTLVNFASNVISIFFPMDSNIKVTGSGQPI